MHSVMLLKYLVTMAIVYVFSTKCEPSVVPVCVMMSRCLSNCISLLIYLLFSQVCVFLCQAIIIILIIISNHQVLCRINMYAFNGN